MFAAIYMSPSVVFDMWVVPWTDPLDLVDRQMAVDDLPEYAVRGYCDVDLPQDDCDDTTDCAVSRPRASPENDTGVLAVTSRAQSWRFAASVGA